MKRRVYLIAILAMINIAIMKYKEYKDEQNTHTEVWTHAGTGPHDADSLLGSRQK